MTEYLFMRCVGRVDLMWFASHSIPVANFRRSKTQLHFCSSSPRLMLRYVHFRLLRCNGYLKSTTLCDHFPSRNTRLREN